MTKEDLESVNSRGLQLYQMKNSELEIELDKIRNSFPDPASPQWQWSINYMKSVVNQFNSRIGHDKGLSSKQLHYVARIEKEIELFPDQVKAESNFKEEYLKSKELQSDLDIVIRYYEQTQYFSSFVSEYNRNKDNKDWAPTKKQWDRIINGNKYVQRLLTAAKNPEQFSAGQFVTFRANCWFRSQIEKVEHYNNPGLMVARTYKTGDLLMVLN